VSGAEYCKLLKENKKLKLIKNVLETSLNHKTHGKMFSIVTSTWNPISGCLYDCRYCWAKNLALTKLKTTKRYANGFKPSLNISEFRVRFGNGDIVFVADMGDMFAPSIPDKWIKQVLEHIEQFPDADFLFMTKNPKRYLDLLPFIPQNAILGATIETNIDSIISGDKVSLAPPPSERAEAMKNLEWDRKIVSIEPVLEFDLKTLVKWLTDIDPFIVYVGYDNYCNRLHEPSMQQTLNLMQHLSDNALVIKKTIRPAWSEDSK
jgi:DNA repair photolyase